MSELSIRRVTVIGAGTTGGALAAYLTNLGLSVTLIDLTASVAANAITHLRSSLYVPERAGEIRVFGLEDGLASLADADWIVEAIPERLELKRALYARIAPAMRVDAVVTTCGCSLPVAEMVEGLPEAFATRFFAAYFSLPLAEHRLVEIRPGLDFDLAESFGRFLSDTIARRVILLPNGPGGVVARYGLWCLLLATHVAEKLRLDIEEVEAISSLNQQRTGVYGAVDRIGLDELRDVAANLRQRLPDDRGVRFLALPSSFVSLLARGWVGDKSGRGFFRPEGRERLALDLTTMAYRQARVPSLPGLAVGAERPTGQRLRVALGVRDEVGEYLREFLVSALRYAEYLRQLMGLSVLDFDRAMEWGFGWEQGPFALLDELGIGANRYYQAKSYWTGGGDYAPIPEDEVCPRMEDCPVIDRTDGYTIHDLDDGIEAVALHSGYLTLARVEGLIALLSRRGLHRFVLTAESGDWPELDLPFVLESLRGDLPALDAYLATLQTLGEGLETRSSVAAIAIRCVGPSLGLALSCPRIVARAAAEIGFNEARLGLIPTARGTAIMRSLHGANSRKMGEVAVALAEGVVAPNADIARAVGFLRPSDVTEHLPERLLSTAKAHAMSVLPAAIAPFPPVEGPLVGIIDRGLSDRRQRGGLTDHDVSIGQRIRQLVARAAGYEDCLDRERAETLDLGAKALSQARIRHFLETGKVLRN